MKSRSANKRKPRREPAPPEVPEAAPLLPLTLDPETGQLPDEIRRMLEAAYT